MITHEKLMKAQSLLIVVNKAHDQSLLSNRIVFTDKSLIKVYIDHRNLIQCKPNLLNCSGSQACSHKAAYTKMMQQLLQIEIIYNFACKGRNPNYTASHSSKISPTFSRCSLECQPKNILYFFVLHENDPVSTILSEY